MVRVAGLEPARVAPLPPQSSVSANSTIRAAGQLLNQFNAGVASAFSRHRSWSRDGHGRTSVAPRQPKRAARITAKARGGDAATEVGQASREIGRASWRERG